MTLSPPYYSANYPYFKIALFIFLSIQLCPLPIFFPKIKYVSGLDVPSFTDITATHEPHETGKLHNPHFLYAEHVLQALA